MIQLQQFIALINIPVMIMFLLGGIAATRMLSKWTLAGVYKTLIVGSIFVFVYTLTQYLAGDFHRSELTSYLVTYCFTTSLYEVLLKRFMDWVQSVLQNSK